MKLDIPLDSAITITVDPLRKVLSITDEAGAHSPNSCLSSCHVWNKDDGHTNAQHDHSNAAARRLPPRNSVAFIGSLSTRRLTTIGSLIAVCFLGFVYARYSGPSADPAPQEAMVAHQVPSSLQLPSSSHVDVRPSAPGNSPNAAFGLD